MAADDKTVRVFISSTFRDMHAERDHLVTVVFPELRERLERLGLELYDVDLRWGLPAIGVDGERANSWEYCKKWIDAVEPFFVCILGQRYGYVPPSDQIKDPEDRAAFEGMSITEMEIRHAVLRGRHRKRSFFYFRQTPVPKDAAAEALERFLQADSAERLTTVKTAIERDSRRPVRVYPCRWTGDGFDDLDAFGRMVLEDLWSGVLRDPGFKEAWQKTVDHDAELYADDSRPIPEDVWKQLVEHIRPEPKNLVDSEAEQMAAFAKARLKWFQGREEELRELTEFVGDLPPEAPRLCVVSALPGQGKSALLAKFAEKLAGSRHVVVTHFVGATERSADARTLLSRLVAELDRNGVPHPEEDAPGEDLESLRKRLATRLEGYDAERRIVIVVDAVNQLAAGHDLRWLPARLGPNVRILLSCIRDLEAKPDTAEARTLDAIENRRPKPIDLDGLQEDDVREIVGQYLKEYCKELDEAPREAIAKMPQARNPLYLLVMLHELRTLGGDDMHAKVPDLIAKFPTDYPDTVALFTWVLERLEVFGKENTRRWFTYLSLGRAGMSSQELSDL
ncbi:MAG: DUF4062 domain-containing protein, partial [Deferrisomatales bacterium]